MSNDIERFNGGGEVQPYSPSQPLQPTHDDWGVEPDYLTERQHSGQVRLFGEALPPGATVAHVQQAVGQISGVFLSDFSILGHEQKHIQAAIAWLQSVATRPPQQEAKRNSFPLYQYEGDPMAIAFSNAMHRAGASAKFVSDALWWITELEKQVGNYGKAHEQAPATDGSNSDQLDDQTYNALYDYNEKMKPHTQDILRTKWQDSYHLNLQMVDRYLQGLSAVEQDHFDQFLNNGLHALNDPTVILGLYQQAIGGGSIPQSGAALQYEISACEQCMKYERKKWLSDERLQARYRHLLTLRNG